MSKASTTATVFRLTATEQTVSLPSGHVVPVRSRYGYVEQAPGESPEPYWESPLPVGLKPRPSIEVAVEVRDGQPVVTEFSVRRPADDPVTGAGLRLIPFKEVIDRVLGALVVIPAQTSGALPNPISDDDHAAIVQSVSRSFNRRRITPELLREVADVARSNPERRTIAVQEHFHTGHRNATRWIAEAMKNYPEEGTNDG